jgi:hypothetical protein
MRTTAGPLPVRSKAIGVPSAEVTCSMLMANSLSATL